MTRLDVRMCPPPRLWTQRSTTREARPLAPNSNNSRDDWTLEALAARDFVGWIPWSACPAGLDAINSSAGGVYVILRDGPVDPVYLDRSPAGVFRGDPTVGQAALDANWVPSARVVYIGKADHGRLQTRLKEFIDFGRGGTRRHWGGRLIWQLDKSDQLLVAWRVLPKNRRPQGRRGPHDPGLQARLPQAPLRE